MAASELRSRSCSSMPSRVDIAVVCSSRDRRRSSSRLKRISILAHSPRIMIIVIFMSVSMIFVLLFSAIENLIDFLDQLCISVAGLLAFSLDNDNLILPVHLELEVAQEGPDHSLNQLDVKRCRFSHLCMRFFSGFVFCFGDLNFFFFFAHIAWPSHKSPAGIQSPTA